MSTGIFMDVHQHKENNWTTNEKDIQQQQQQKCSFVATIILLQVIVMRIKMLNHIIPWLPLLAQAHGGPPSPVCPIFMSGFIGVQRHGLSAPATAAAKQY